MLIMSLLCNSLNERLLIVEIVKNGGVILNRYL